MPEYTANEAAGQKHTSSPGFGMLVLAIINLAFDLFIAALGPFFIICRPMYSWQWWAGFALLAMSALHFYLLIRKRRFF